MYYMCASRRRLIDSSVDEALEASDMELPRVAYQVAHATPYIFLPAATFFLVQCLLQLLFGCGRRREDSHDFVPMGIPVAEHSTPYIDMVRAHP